MSRRQKGLRRTAGRIGLARVTGDSMLPTLRGGDLLLVRHGAPVKAGDLVLARFADQTLTVKRAMERRSTHSGGAGWWLVSDNAEVGVDSRHRGPVPDEHVFAVVRLRVWPSPRLGPGLSAP